MPDRSRPVGDRLAGRVHDRHLRTLVKTVGYRALMVLTTIAVAFGVTGDAGAALNIGIVANAIKTVAYYGYERLWARVSWGTVQAE